MSRARQRVLVAGASGYIGRHVVAALTERGHEVVALVRADRAPLERVERVRAEATDADSLRRALTGHRYDAVVSCLATRSGVPEDAWRVEHDANQNLLAAARDTRAARFVLLSAICVQRPRLAFQRAKLAFEALLAGAGLSHAIVRPTAFFKSLSGQIPRVRAGKPFLVFGDGRSTACKPIAESDLASFLADLVEQTERMGIFPIGGPGPAITPREQGTLLFELLGARPRFRSVPVGAFDAAAAVLGGLGRLVPSLANKAELARIARYYATESMLLWNEAAGRYDADATPETGRITLREHYERVLREGLAGQELREHAIF